MIISQDIKGGYVRVKRQGHYFSLISASGIVRVILQLKGEDVLRSDFWVGMSINDPIEFDTIIIQGADAPVEFWASKVSVNNQGSINLKGANAIRASKIAVMGETLITSSDLTRMAIRVRTDKEVFLGGAGINGTGWRLPVGSYEEIPLAGSLYAYKQPPKLDLSKTTATPRNDTMWPSSIGTGFYHFIHVSNDENTRIASGTTKTNLSLDGGQTWEEHPDLFPTSHRDRSFYYSRNRGELWCVIKELLSNYTYSFFVSKDEGKTFTKVSSLNYYALTGVTRTDFTLEDLKLSGSWLTCGLNSLWMAFNIETLEQFAQRKEDIVDHQSTTYYIGSIYMPMGNTREFYERTITTLNSEGKANCLRKTNDGGQSWTVISNNINSMGCDESGKYVWLRDTANKMSLSSDFGQTFIKNDVTSMLTNKIIYVANGLFVGVYGEHLYAFYPVGDELIVERVDSAPTAGMESFANLTLTDNGVIFRSPKTGAIGVTEGSTYQLSIEGDLSPALVEVMELLS